ncbi:MAG: hypothetical protein Q7K42_03340, partial [Candidatus Diapherotrites archaeon]|nr:hypothetical protein [Candidatus Diapherotrites archaeon]
MKFNRVFFGLIILLLLSSLISAQILNRIVISPPVISYSIDKTGLATGSGVVLKFSASNSNGLLSISWQGQKTGLPELDALQSFDCSGQTTCATSWTIKPSKPGKFLIRLSALDRQKYVQTKHITLLIEETSTTTTDSKTDITTDSTPSSTSTTNNTDSTNSETINSEITNSETTTESLDSVPDVSFSFSKTEIFETETVSAVVKAFDDKGLSSISWQGLGTGIPEFDKEQIFDCGLKTECSKIWIVPFKMAGSFVFKAKALDSSKQVSESAEVKVFVKSVKPVVDSNKFVDENNVDENNFVAEVPEIVEKDVNSDDRLLIEKPLRPERPKREIGKELSVLDKRKLERLKNNSRNVLERLDQDKLQKVVSRLPVKQLDKLDEQQAKNLSELEDNQLEKVKKIDEKELDNLKGLEQKELGIVTRLNEQDFRKITKLNEQDFAVVSKLDEQQLQKVSSLVEEKIRKISNLGEEQRQKIVDLGQVALRKVASLPEKDLKAISVLDEKKIDFFASNVNKENFAVLAKLKNLGAFSQLSEQLSKEDMRVLAERLSVLSIAELRDIQELRVEDLKELVKTLPKLSEKRQSFVEKAEKFAEKRESFNDSVNNVKDVEQEILELRKQISGKNEEESAEIVAELKQKTIFLELEKINALVDYLKGLHERGIAVPENDSLLAEFEELRKTLSAENLKDEELTQASLRMRGLLLEAKLVSKKSIAVSLKAKLSEALAKSEQGLNKLKELIKKLELQGKNTSRVSVLVGNLEKRILKAKDFSKKSKFLDKAEDLSNKNGLTDEEKKEVGLLVDSGKQEAEQIRQELDEFNTEFKQAVQTVSLLGKGLDVVLSKDGKFLQVVLSPSAKIDFAFNPADIHSLQAKELSNS